MSSDVKQMKSQRVISHPPRGPCRLPRVLGAVSSPPLGQKQHKLCIHKFLKILPNGLEKKINVL